MSTGPTINRGGSRQDYETPDNFMQAVQNRFGMIHWDLAANAQNSKCGTGYFGPGGTSEDSFLEDWHEIGGMLWLNPEFNNITPWARKCAYECELGAKILFLTPASVGSNWFRDHVHHKALVLALNGRLKFVGEEDCYPKDLILSVYGLGSGFDVWNWRNDL